MSKSQYRYRDMVPELLDALGKAAGRSVCAPDGPYTPGAIFQQGFRVMEVLDISGSARPIISVPLTTMGLNHKYFAEALQTFTAGVEFAKQQKPVAPARPHQWRAPRIDKPAEIMRSTTPYFNCETTTTQGFRCFVFQTVNSQKQRRDKWHFAVRGVGNGAAATSEAAKTAALAMADQEKERKLALIQSRFNA